MALITRTGEVRYSPNEKGAKMRMRVWAEKTSYLAGKYGEAFYDIALHDGLLYLCILSHTSVATETPKQNVASGKIKYWEPATTWAFIATKLLLAEKITADMIDANGITAKNVNISGIINAVSGSFDNGIFSNVSVESGKIGGFTLQSGQLFWKQNDYINNDSRSLKLGVSKVDTEGVIDVSFNAATFGRFGIKSVGSNAGGAAIYASTGALTYPASGMTYAGYFVGPVDVRDTGNGLISDVCASQRFRAITKRNANGTYEYNEGVDWGNGMPINPDLDNIRLIVRGGIIVGYTGE